MQVFLPFPDVKKSLQILDRYRLGKQRIEARQIIDCVPGSSWYNHPARKMFAGYIPFLCHYYNNSLIEWIGRGYNNTMHYRELLNYDNPWWFGLDKFHTSHQSNLLRKAISDAKGIGKFGKSKKPSRELLDRLAKVGIMEETVDPSLDYFWPI